MAAQRNPVYLTAKIDFIEDVVNDIFTIEKQKLYKDMEPVFDTHYKFCGLTVSAFQYFGEYFIDARNDVMLPHKARGLVKEAREAFEPFYSRHVSLKEKERAVEGMLKSLFAFTNRPICFHQLLPDHLHKHIMNHRAAFGDNDYKFNSITAFIESHQRQIDIINSQRVLDKLIGQ